MSAAAHQSASSDAGKIRQRRLHAVETSGTLAWLAMDFCWMLDYSAAAVMCGLISLVSWIWSLDLVKDPAERAASGAIVQWVLMNLIWMTADQYDMPDLRRWAVLTALLSLAMILYSLHLAGWNFSVARFFRRFRARS